MVRRFGAWMHHRQVPTRMSDQTEGLVGVAPSGVSSKRLDGARLLDTSGKGTRQHFEKRECPFLITTARIVKQERFEDWGVPLVRCAYK